ncbi:hypothetical protein EVAR_82127_1 [Eumeta japonica]|uniref:Uncharacterized protein n=1 Tax=Eumeta variegata TaxID=151549 RepID=A0A4C1U2G8_EUMVA|nr:hypothetical protein EVAR_82127_1 [Eumeta japonica]
MLNTCTAHHIHPTKTTRSEVRRERERNENRDRIVTEVESGTMTQLEYRDVTAARCGPRRQQPSQYRTCGVKSKLALRSPNSIDLFFYFAQESIRLGRTSFPLISEITRKLYKLRNLTAEDL